MPDQGKTRATLCSGSSQNVLVVSAWMACESNRTGGRKQEPVEATQARFNTVPECYRNLRPSDQEEDVKKSTRIRQTESMDNCKPAERRFIRTLLFFMLTLISVDLWVWWIFAPGITQTFTHDYRLPENQEMAWLPFYIQALEKSTQPTLVFIGSSPTYGIRIQDPKQTFPVATLKALQAMGPEWKNWQVYNLSAKGFLLADQYFLLKKVLHRADYLVIQLNYHTFSPALLRNTRIRHPEMPEKLGVTVSEAEAALLGLRPSPPLPLNDILRQGLRKIWAFYRLRELISAQWFGNTPEGWVFAQYEKVLGIQAEALKGSTPFLELKPAQQMMVLRRYTQNAGFALAADNSELQILRWMVQLLKQAGKSALFFMGPLNVEALDAYGALDWKRYDSVVKPLQAVVEARGSHWLDINRHHFLPADHFFDITHTLNPGGRAMGQILAETLSPLLKTESP